ncbi:MAG: aldehyde dehydrogenase family protein [Roseinatronobacter sp.]
METQLLIDNARVPAEGGSTFERVAPTDGKTVTRGAAAGINDSIAAVEAAHRAFQSWSRSGPGERRALLSRSP